MENSKTILNPENWSSIYADELFNYAMTKTDKVELAEDFVQDVFLGALKAMESFKGQCSERTWLSGSSEHFPNLVCGLTPCANAPATIVTWTARQLCRGHYAPHNTHT